MLYQFTDALLELLKLQVSPGDQLSEESRQLVEQLELGVRDQSDAAPKQTKLSDVGLVNGCK